MIIETLIVGPFEVNAYVVYRQAGSDTVIIDPGGNGEDILALVSLRRLCITHIINTHGHGDHIGANGLVKEAFPDAKICIHHRDAHMLTDAHANLSMAFEYNVTSPPADMLLDGGTGIEAAGINFRVEHVPGHTPGSICLLPDASERVVFTGDALFAGSVGRADMPGGNMRLLLSSISEKLMCLPEDTVVYPGHGVSTTIGAERRHNPFVGDGRASQRPGGPFDVI